MSGAAGKLNALRKRRRAIAWALLPAIALWAASGSACFAMLASATAAGPSTEHAAEAHAGHHSSGGASGSHAQHGHTPAPMPAPAPDCPHCPPGHVAADGAHSTCSVNTDAASSAAKSSPAGDATPLLPVRWVPATVSAAPPLIRPTPSAAARRAAGVPIHLRRSVLRI